MNKPHPDCQAPHMEDSWERMKTRIDKYFCEKEALLDRVMLRKWKYATRKPLPWWVIVAACAAMLSLGLGIGGLVGRLHG